MHDKTKTASGSAVIDELLDGGFENDTITTIYGPFSSGKTTICIIAAIQMARSGKKVIYVDTESSFSVDRLRQLAPDDYREILEKMIFIAPTSFQNQKSIFQKLAALVTESIGLIIVDSIAIFYRLSKGGDVSIQDVNKEMRIQLYYLSDIAKIHRIPVIITNQVYANFEIKDEVRIVGGDLILYSSKCVVELQKMKNAIRKGIVRKHRSIPEGKEIYFEILHEGISKYDA